MSESATILRFDVFELDTGSGELRKHGDRIKLPPQPFRVLEMLVRRSGEVLTRDEIRERIRRGSRTTSKVRSEVLGILSAIETVEVAGYCR